MNKQEAATKANLPSHGRDKGVALAKENNEKLRALHRANGKKVHCNNCNYDITSQTDTFMPSDGQEYCNGMCYVANLRNY